MIGAGVFAVFAPAAAAAGAGSSSGWCSRRSSPTATRSRRRSSLRSTRRRVARTSTDASGSVTGGASSQVGDSSSARQPRAPRWRSHSPPTRCRGLSWRDRLVAVVVVVLLTGVNLRGDHADGRSRPHPRGRRHSSPGRRRRNRARERSRRGVTADRGRRSRRGLRDSPGSRASLLRIRWLRQDRDARRGGARSRADDPASDLDRLAATVVVYAAVASRSTGGARADLARGRDDVLSQTPWTRSARLGGAGRADRSGGCERGSAPGSRRRGRSHSARDGARG